MTSAPSTTILVHPFVVLVLVGLLFYLINCSIALANRADVSEMSKGHTADVCLNRILNQLQLIWMEIEWKWNGIEMEWNAMQWNEM